MSEKGYLLEKREDQIAKLLDTAIDFDDLLKDKKKFLGVINIGNFLERNDRKIFKSLIQLLDDHCLGKNPDQAKVDAIEKAFQYIEKEDVQGFSDHVAGVLSGEIDIPYIDYDKQVFLSVLMLFNGLIGKAISKIHDKLAEAEAEA